MIACQADSASDINVWGKNHFKDLCKKLGNTLKLTRAPKPIRAANKTLIKVDGFFNATLRSKTASRVSRIFVKAANDPDLPLMSRFDLHSLNYIKIDPDGNLAVNKVNTVENKEDLSEEEFKTLVDKLHTKYKKVFIGIGRYKYKTIDLEVKPGSVPFVLRAIPCPIYLRKPALKRLNSFVKLGILIPLPVNYPISYCSPLLVVPKPNKPDEVRLVANYKKLNL